MAEAAGSREQPAAGRAPPDAGHRAEEEPEPASLDAPVAAAGRRRGRRSGVSAVGTAERFPGGSLGPAAAPDTDACLLEAAKATPRRSSIIKICLSAAFPEDTTVLWSGRCEKQEEKFNCQITAPRSIQRVEGEQPRK